MAEAAEVAHTFLVLAGEGVTAQPAEGILELEILHSTCLAAAAAALEPVTAIQEAMGMERLEDTGRLKPVLMTEVPAVTGRLRQLNTRAALEVEDQQDSGVANTQLILKGGPPAAATVLA